MSTNSVIGVSDYIISSCDYIIASTDFIITVGTPMFSYAM